MQTERTETNGRELIRNYSATLKSEVITIPVPPSLQNVPK